MTNPYWFIKEDSSYSQTVSFVGEERAEKQYPMKSLFVKGIVASQAGDYPVTQVPNPLEGIQFGVTRQFAGKPEIVTMGGFGGSVKNIAIGCTSGHVGKAQVHAPDLNDLPGDDDDDRWPEGEIFMEHMTDSAKATCDHFGKHIIFINVMRRISVDCDCADVEAEEPTIADSGICASTDILAVDQACVDMVYSAPDGKDLNALPSQICLFDMQLTKAR